MDNQMNKNKGFSLVELLIAVTLLSIIMIMVTQFMSSTSWAITKTQKNQNIQTEAMEVGGQFSDAIMQATYIRVRTQDNKIYTVDTNLDANGERIKREINPTETLTEKRDFVVDNYPNFLNPSEKNRQIILNEADYTLVDVDKKEYPETGVGNQDNTKVLSFRKLTSNRVSTTPGVADDPSAKPLYIKPMYIYIQYQNKVSGTETTDYIIYYFKDNKVYMDTGAVSGLACGDGFGQAVNAASNTAVKKVETNANNGIGLVTESMSDCYFSADTEASTVYLDMLFEDERFEDYTYNYVDSIILRNSNVLTVPPQQMYKTK